MRGLSFSTVSDLESIAEQAGPILIEKQITWTLSDSYH